MESLAYYWDTFLAIESDRLLFYGEAAKRFQSYVAWSGTLQVLVAWHVFEYLIPWHRSQPKWRPLLGLDFFWLVLTGVLFYALIGDALVQTGLLVFHHALYQVTGIGDLMFVSLEGLPIWVGWLLLFLVTDFSAWGGHWLLHRSNFLWQFHKIHHSSTQLDIWNAQRFHFGEALFWSFFQYLPLTVIGFPPDDLLIVLVVSGVLSNFTHANVRVPLGPLRFVLNNPQLHIWHHAKAIDANRNVNFGDALCVWDYLFGTAYLPEEQENLELGFDGVEDYPTSIPGQVVAPFVDLYRMARARIAAVFA